MKDTIYRQDAIDALEKWESESTWDEWCYDHKDEAEKYNIISPSSVVFNLPSAQTEIVRCKDCVRYGEPECLMAYDGKQWAEDDGFCHEGERWTG